MSDATRGGLRLIYTKAVEYCFSLPGASEENAKDSIGPQFLYIRITVKLLRTFSYLMVDGLSISSVTSSGQISSGISMVALQRDTSLTLFIGMRSISPGVSQTMKC